MKILKENNTIRLLMRREQVHKVCCNHQLLKNISFKKMPSNPKAVSWCAQDFSEEVLKTEMFAIRFKGEEQADAFVKAITSAQSSLDENNVLEDKPEIPVKKQERNQHAKLKVEPKSPEAKPDASPKSSWGDKFKPKSGSWNCKNCYINNEAKNNHCVACDSPKNDSVPKKDSPQQTFSFGGAAGQSGFLFGVAQSAEQKQSSGFGDAFKPKEGNDNCYLFITS